MTRYYKNNVVKYYNNYEILFKRRLFNITWYFYKDPEDDDSAIRIYSKMDGFSVRDDFVLEIKSRIIEKSMFLFCKLEYIGHIMQSGNVIDSKPFLCSTVCFFSVSVCYKLPP